MKITGKKKISMMNILLSLFAIGFSFIIVTESVRAVTTTNTNTGTYTVLAPLPCIESPSSEVTLSDGTKYTVPAITCKGGNGAVQTEVDFKTYVQYTFNLLIALAAVTAVAMIVYGGIEYMMSASSLSKKDGKERVTNAIYGLVLILCSFIILRTVDPRLVEIPTTIVPKISLRPELKVNSSQELMNQIIKEADEYKKKHAEMTAEWQKSANDRAASEKKLDDINNKIKSSSANPDDPEYQKLLADQKNATNELKQTQINDVNLYFKNRTSEALLFASMDVKDMNLDNNNTAATIQKLNDYKYNVGENYKTAKKAYAELGQNDLTPLQNEAMYTNNLIDLIKVAIMINGVGTIAESSSMQGSYTPAQISVPKADGTGFDTMTLNDSNAAKIKAELQMVIEKTKVSIENIKDNDLKNKLQTKIASTDLALKNKFKNL